MPGTHNEKPLVEEERAERLDSALSRLKPGIMAGIGIGGLAVITGLMWFKPF
jgi:hypothetical protein